MKIESIFFIIIVVVLKSFIGILRDEERLLLKDLSCSVVIFNI